MDNITRKKKMHDKGLTPGLGGRIPYLMVMPSVLLLALCYIFPIGYMIYLSFFKWDMLTEMEPLGWENYVDMFQKEEFHQVLGNTFVFTFVTVGITLCLAMVFAVWLNHNSKIHRFVQAAIFSPHIIALVSVSFVWMWMMDPNYGLLNLEMSRNVQSGNTQNLKSSVAPVRLPAAPASTPGTSQAATQAGCVYRP